MSIEEMGAELATTRRKLGTLARTIGKRIAAAKRRSVWCRCGCGTKLPPRREPGHPLRYVNPAHRYRAGNVRAWARKKGTAT